MIQVQNLTHRYGDRIALSNVNFEVQKGEVFGLLGPNGGGKSTLFRILSTMMAPTAGTAAIAGHDVTREPAAVRRHVGVVFQTQSLDKALTVEQNLRAVLERTVPSRLEQMRRVKDLLEEFGLWELRRQKAWTLSGGEKRRLEVARAMISDPKIFMLGEPFVGIDPITVGELKAMISALKNRGIGILITDHNVRETLSVTDRAYIIAEGRIFRAGTPHELGNDVEVRRVYLGEGFSLG